MRKEWLRYLCRLFFPGDSINSCSAQNRVQPDLIAAKVVSLLNSGSSHKELALRDQDWNTGSRHSEDSDPTDSPPRQSRKIFKAQVNRIERWKTTSTTKRLALKRTGNNCVVGFRPPLWLAGWMFAWDLNVRRSYAGWDVNLRIYSIRPRGLECFQAVQRGDITQLKKLLITREMTPFDRDDLGRTLLHVSSSSK